MHEVAIETPGASASNAAAAAALAAPPASAAAEWESPPPAAAAPPPPVCLWPEAGPGRSPSAAWLCPPGGVCLRSRTAGLCWRTVTARHAQAAASREAAFSVAPPLKALRQ